MGHHYLPQHYLRGFAMGKAIWAHDLRESKSYRSQVKSVANENSFYTEDLEAHLANAVEGPAQAAIDKIRALLPLDVEDREAISHYVVALWKRVPTARKRVEAAFPYVADTVNAQIQRRLDEVANENPSLTELVVTKKAEVNNVMERYKEDPPDYFWHHSVSIGATPRMVQGLLDMQWVILVSDKEHFITSDNPVFFFESEGIASAQSEISVPLGSNVALWASKGRPYRPGLLLVERGIVLEVNRRSARNAERYLYTQSESPWVLSFARKRHALKRLW
jgi:hypothetical protein